MRKLLLATAASLSTLLGAGTALAQPAEPVAPGTVNVHLKGYLQFMFGTMGGNGMTGGSGATAYKNNNIGTVGDIRLYPGFDGMTTNGIAYGAALELRTATSNANGKGVNSNSTSSNGVDSLYVRRAYGYIGAEQAGYVRFGQTDSAFGLLQTGVIEAFGDGNQWTADGGLVNLLPSGAPGQFIYADQGALYTTDKIVYITPAFEDPMGGKLSASVGFEPNSNGIKEGDASFSSDLGLANDSIAGGSSTRRRNTFDGMVAYAIKAGGFATKLSAGYLTGSPLGNLTGPEAYDPLSVFQVGAQTTFKGLATDSDSITVGANLKTGAVEDGYAFKPKGERDALAYIIGASYVNGPIEVGGSYFNSQSSGAATPTNHDARTLSEYGVAVGADYSIAKPMSLWIEYLYGHKHQPGAIAGNGNQAQALGLGATIKW